MAAMPARSVAAVVRRAGLRMLARCAGDSLAERLVASAALLAGLFFLVWWATALVADL